MVTNLAVIALAPGLIWIFGFWPWLIIQLTATAVSCVRKAVSQKALTLGIWEQDRAKARERRIEYARAIDHVMARGNRREDIMLDDDDRLQFEETLLEVVEKRGWARHAWVLMNNHYHMGLKTPEPNMVKGMAWFQAVGTLPLLFENSERWAIGKDRSQCLAHSNS